MFCNKCGQEIPDNQMFCSFCGSAVQLTPEQTVGNQQMGAPGQQFQQMGPQGQQFQQMGPQGQQFQQMPMQPQRPPKKQKTPAEKAKTKKAIIITCVLLALVLAIGGGLLLFFMLKTPTINLNDYITIECDGYNSIGKAQAVFDEEQFYDDYEEKLKFKSSKAEENSDYASAAEHLLENYIKGSLDKDTNLSNGDSIKYKWDIDEEGVKTDLKVELEYDDIDYKVEGLEDAETFDLFSNVSVDFEGSAPNGRVVISNNSNTYPVNYWTFEADKSEGLSNGDKITVSFAGTDEDIDECVEETGKIPDTLSKEFEVTGLSSYVTAASQITNDSLNSMKTKAVNNAEADLPYEAENARYDYVGYYLLKEKPDVSPSYRNILVMVYAVSTDLDIVIDESNYVGNYGYYSVTTFYDIELDETGSSLVDTSKSDESYNELILNTHVDDKWGTEYRVSYWGYESLADVKRNCVDNNLSDYDLEEVIDSSVTPVASTGSASSNAQNGMVVPDSDTRYLTESEVRGMSQEEIQDAINEIYARHGYIFQTDSIQRYYEQFSWYTPYSGEQEKVKKLFNSVETANVLLLDKYRD